MAKKTTPTPFSYFGSKHRLALELSQNLPPHNCWVELFCGSAAVTLAKEPTNIEVINDIDSEIVNFFKQLRDNPEELNRAIMLTPYAAQELKDARAINTEDSNLERARKFIVQAMMAINGAFGKEQGGFSVSHSYSRNGVEARVNRWNNLPERLDKVTQRLKQVRIENKNALTLMKKYINRPATLIYLDPPYYADRVNGYKKDANDKEFHEKLLKLISDAKCMIFISGYESELYNTYLSNKNGWTRKEFMANTKGSNGESHPRKEIVWTNHNYIAALESKIVPIKLTEKEKKNKKINPER